MQTSLKPWLRSLLFPDLARDLPKLPPSSDQEFFLTILKVFQKHRIPVAVLPKEPLKMLNERSESFRNFLQEEIRAYNESLRAYLQVCSEWHKENIPAVLLKAAGYYPYKSSNVDVLVPRNRLKEAMAVIESLGYVELPHMREPYKWLYRRIKKPYLAFPIHLHTAVAWISLFFEDHQILEEAFPHAEIPEILYPSATMAFLITTAHWFFEDKRFTLRDLLHIVWAVRQGVRWEQAWELANRTGWGQVLRAAVELYQDTFRYWDLPLEIPTPPEKPGRLIRFSRDPETEVWKVKKYASKFYHMLKSARNKDLNYRRRISEVFKIVYFALKVKIPRRTPPRIVAISGPDGAGKTTLARDTAEVLKKFYKSVRVQWLRVGSTPGAHLLKRAAEVLHLREPGKRMKRKPPTPGSKPSLPRKLWLMFLALDFVFWSWMVRLKHRVQGGIVILDRYKLDAYVDLRLIHQFVAAAKMVLLAPEPDLSVLITLRPEESLRRSHTVPYPELVRDALRIFNEMRHHFDLILDGEKERETLQEQLLRQFFDFRPSSQDQEDYR